MKTKKVVEARVEKLIDKNWLYVDRDPEGNGDITRVTQDNIEECAKFYGVPALFLRMLDDAVRSMANDIIGELTLDLEDIWGKVDTG